MVDRTKEVTSLCSLRYWRTFHRRTDNEINIIVLQTKILFFVIFCHWASEQLNSGWIKFLLLAECRLIMNQPHHWTFPPHGLTCPCVSARTCRRPSGRTSFCSSSLVWRRQEMAPPPRPLPSPPCWAGSPGGEKTHLLRFIPPSVRWSLTLAVLAGYRRHVCQQLWGARHKPTAEAIFSIINCFSCVKLSKSSLPSSVPMMKPPRKTKDVIIHLLFTVLTDFETLTECESWSRSSGGGLLC